jgi:hypothetical protein
MQLRELFICAVCVSGVGGLVFAQQTKLSADAPEKSLYENNFEKAEVGKLPDEFLLLDGGFAVREEAGNKFLELPGAPLDTYGVLFGPTFDPKQDRGVAVFARFYGTGKGRRFPTFGLGANGQGGYRLQVSPAKEALELCKAESEVVASVPFKWESGSWTILRLQLQKVKDGEWRIEGKAWKQGAQEPDRWAISHVEKGELLPGRASIWGSPFAGTPIRFDDLRVLGAARN